jgi:hypothetical protein
MRDRRLTRLVVPGSTAGARAELLLGLALVLFLHCRIVGLDLLFVFLRRDKTGQVPA